MHSLDTHQRRVAWSASALLLCLGTARADIKVVATVSVHAQGVPASAQPRPQTVVTYYKANRIRTEAGKSISIYDTDSQIMYSLDPQSKTYRATSMKNMVGSLAPGMLSKLKFDATASTRDTAEDKLIAGKSARKYVCNATISMRVDGMPQGSFPTTRMVIEQWASDAVNAPGDAKKWALPLSRMTGPLASMDGMKPLTDAMTQIKGFPLSNRITTTTVAATASSFPGSRRAPAGPVTTTTEVRAISEAPLSGALFTVPKEYKKVESASKPTLAAPPTAGAGHAH